MLSEYGQLQNLGCVQGLQLFHRNFKFLWKQKSKYLWIWNLFLTGKTMMLLGDTCSFKQCSFSIKWVLIFMCIRFLLGSLYLVGTHILCVCLIIIMWVPTLYMWVLTVYMFECGYLLHVGTHIHLYKHYIQCKLSVTSRCTKQTYKWVPTLRKY